MRAVILIENREKKGFACEHGLSVYIEYREKKYLLDTGSSDLFLQNAKKLGIDLSLVDVAILSHGHYDHSGGYYGFLEENKRAKLYLRKEAGEKYFFFIPNKVKRYIGIPQNLLKDYKERVVFVDRDMQLSDGVWLIAHRGDDLEQIGRKNHMYRESEGLMYYDNFHHEQSLVFETGAGLVLFNSCSHIGIVRIVREVKQAFGGQKVCTVVGGFHLKASSIDSLRVPEAEVRNTARALLEEGVEKIYTGHCTGNPAFAILKEELGKRVEYLEVGREILNEADTERI